MINLDNMKKSSLLMIIRQIEMLLSDFDCLEFAASHLCSLSLLPTIGQQAFFFYRYLTVLAKLFPRLLIALNAFSTSPSPFFATFVFPSLFLRLFTANFAFFAS